MRSMMSSRRWFRQPRTLGLNPLDTVILLALVVGGAGAFYVKLHAPPYVVRGGSATLICNHTVDSELLHKVEWLKDGDRKLFQYVRGRNPPFRNFTIPGAKLDWGRSNERQIRLTGLELEASGVYSCEVSMETPIYTKPSHDEVITVIQRQAEDPEVWGRKPSYAVGERLEVNCTSAPSHPPADITWFVNGRQLYQSPDESLDLRDEYQLTTASEKSLKWFPGYRAHPYHHHHRSRGHHHMHHHHRQYKLRSQWDSGMGNGDEMGDADDLELELDSEPAVLPAMTRAPASTTVQLTLQISEKHALEGLSEGFPGLSSQLELSKDGTSLSGRIGLTCMATIPAFLGAGAKEHEYADRRLTSVSVDVIMPAPTIVKEEEVRTGRNEESSEIKSSSMNNACHTLVPLSLITLLAHVIMWVRIFTGHTFNSTQNRQRVVKEEKIKILTHDCPCR